MNQTRTILMHDGRLVPIAWALRTSEVARNDSQKQTVMMNCQKSIRTFTANTGAVALLVVCSSLAGGCGAPSQMVKPLVAPVLKVGPPVLLESQLALLDKMGATTAQWAKAAEGPPTPISTLEQLRAAILATGGLASEAERERQREHMERLFHISPQILFFGFDCDYHAIVFFDARGQQIYAHYPRP